MTLDDALKVIKQYGATGVLVIWLFITNNRLTIVEAKLFDCYLTQKAESNTRGNYRLMPEFLAILPSNPIGKIETEI